MPKSCLIPQKNTENTCKEIFLVYWGQKSNFLVAIGKIINPGEDIFSTF